MATTLPKKSANITVKQIKPVYGDNYNKGYIGFTYTEGHIISEGIAYFTKWARMSDIRVTHALIVTGENSCIEANANNNCVEQGNLQKYFNNPHCQIFFRKPKDLTDEIADRIVKVLNPEIGKKYDFQLILTQALAGTFMGYFFDHLLEGKVEDELARILNDPEKWICSELAAYALDEQPEYKDRGILKRPNATISPQELFEDKNREIFKPWKNGTPTQC